MRGAVVMPNGTGKTKRVAVFAQGAKAEEAKAAGADIVGMDDLAASVKAGDMPFDVVIAAPDAMRVVGTLGQILGPRGLMPNPKVGTVTPGRGHRREERQGRPGAVPRRQGRHHPRARSAAARSTPTSCKATCVALIDALNKAKPAIEQGRLPEQGGGVVDDGPGCPRGHADRLGVRKSKRIKPARASRCARRCGGLPGRRRTGGPSKTVGAGRMRLIEGHAKASSTSQRRWRSRRKKESESFLTVGRCN